MQEIGINSIIPKDIRSGQKTVETRLAKERFLSFKPGDNISIREDFWEGREITASTPGAAKIIVTNVQRFNLFREMFEHIDFKKIIPTASSVDEALQAYEQYYNKEDERAFGVVAISFEIV